MSDAQCFLVDSHRGQHMPITQDPKNFLVQMQSQQSQVDAILNGLDNMSMASRSTAVAQVANPPTQVVPVQHAPLQQPLVQQKRKSVSEDEQTNSPLSITIPEQSNKRSTIIKTAAANTPSTNSEATTVHRDSMLSAVSLASTAVTNMTPVSASSKAEDGQGRARTSPRIDQGVPKPSGSPGQFYMDELVLGEKGRVLGGTPRALVENLIHHTSPAALKLEDTFFLTFKAFVSAEELADLLTGQYKMLTTMPGSTSQQRKRIFDLIKKWVTKFWDIELNREARDRLESFANDHTVHMMPILRQRLLETIRKADIVNQNLEVSTPDAKPTSGSSSSNGEDGQLGPPPEMTKVQISMLMSGAKGASVLDFSPLEIARQLTLLCSQAFCAVKPADLLSSSLTKGSAAPPNILALSRLSTDITNLVSHTIVFTEDAKKRVAILRQWITIAQECLNLQNYDTLMAIMCSLNSAAVSRLSKTWKDLPIKVLESCNELKELCEVGRNFAPLRQRLMTSKLPCLPFIGIFLTDLTFVDAGNGPTRILPSTKDTGSPIEVVNFDRYVRAAAIVNVVQRFQLPYRLQEVAGLRDWLRREMEDARVEDDGTVKNGPTTSEAYQQSVRLEPNGTTDEEKTTLRDADQKKNVLLRKRLFEDKIADADKPVPPKPTVGVAKTMSVSKVAADL